MASIPLEKIIPYWIARVLAASPSDIAFKQNIGLTNLAGYSVGENSSVIIDNNNISMGGVTFPNTGIKSRAFKVYVMGANSRESRGEEIPAHIPRQLESFYLEGKIIGAEIKQIIMREQVAKGMALRR